MHELSGDLNRGRAKQEGSRNELDALLTGYNFTQFTTRTPEGSSPQVPGSPPSYLRGCLVILLGVLSHESREQPC